jgi:hypothetical protein
MALATGSNPFAPSDNEDEDQPQPGSAAMLLPPGYGQTEQPDPAASQAAVPPPAQAMSAIQTAGGQTPTQAQPQQPAVVLPPSPATPPNTLDQYRAYEPQQPAAPVAPPSMTYQYMAAGKKRDADAAPVDRSANAPKWWERVLGGAVGFGVGYKDGPTAGIAAGSKITDSRYDNAVADQKAKLDADDAALQNMQKQQDMSHKVYEDQHTQFDDNDRATSRQQNNADRAAQEQQRLQGIAPGTETPDDPKNPLGTWHATTVGGKPITLQGPPDRWAKTPAGIAAQRDADVTRLNLTGDDAKYYRANGKLKEPGQTTNIHIPSADSQEYGDWKATFTKENGHAPNAQDIQTYRKGEPKVAAATPGQIEVMAGKRDKDYQDLEDKYALLRKAETTDKGRAAVDAARDAEKTTLNQDWSQRFSAADPTGKYAGGGSPPPQVAATPASPSIPVQRVVTPPATHYAPLPPDKVRVRLSDGRIQVGPRSALSAAVKAGAVEVK